MHTLTVVVELSSAAHGEPLLDALSGVLDIARGAERHAIYLEDRDELSPCKLGALRDFIGDLHAADPMGANPLDNLTASDALYLVRRHMPRLAGILADDAMADWNEQDEDQADFPDVVGPGAYIIRGSGGNILLDNDGKVTRLDEDAAANPHYSSITRFDLDEYRVWETPGDGAGIDEDRETDILLIGYWFTDEDGTEVYEPADEDARAGLE